MIRFTLSDIVKLLMKRWWVIASITAVSVMFSGYVSFYHLTPIYANSSTLLVNDRNQQQKTSLTFDDVLLYEKLMGTYKDILTSKRILKPVAETYGQNLTAEAVAGMTKISTNPSSQVITITVSNPDYQIATELANLIAITFSENLKTIMDVDNVQILDPAELKPNPVHIKPNKKLNLIIAFIIGFSLSVLLLIVLQLADTRIRHEEDLSGLTSYPLLGTVPAYKKKGGF